MKIKSNFVKFYQVLFPIKFINVALHHITALLVGWMRIIDAIGFV